MHDFELIMQDFLLENKLTKWTNTETISAICNWHEETAYLESSI